MYFDIPLFWWLRIKSALGLLGLDAYSVKPDEIRTHVDLTLYTVYIAG